MSATGTAGPEAALFARCVSLPVQAAVDKKRNRGTTREAAGFCCSATKTKSISTGAPAALLMNRLVFVADRHGDDTA